MIRPLPTAMCRHGRLAVKFPCQVERYFVSARADLPLREGTLYVLLWHHGTRRFFTRDASGLFFWLKEIAPMPLELLEALA